MLGPPEAYPRHDLTPGEILPEVIAAMVCTPGYATKARHVSDAVKKQVMHRYGLDPATLHSYEIDHWIPLECGGGNTILNLWPQPREGLWNAGKKDLLENVLHSLVCRGDLTLGGAQAVIKHDWIAAYLLYVDPKTR